MTHLFNPNDFVKSTLDGFMVGLIVRYAEVSTYSVPGYIIRLAAGKEVWIAEEDLNLIVPAWNEDEDTDPLAPRPCPNQECDGEIVADGKVQRLPHRGVQMDQFTCAGCGSTYWRNPRALECAEGGQS